MKGLCLFLILTSSGWASECSLWQLKGTVRYSKNYELLIAAKSLSETKIPFENSLQTRVLPYLSRTAEGQFVLKNKKIIKIEKIDYSTFDPLTEGQAEVMKKVKDVPCP